MAELDLWQPGAPLQHPPEEHLLYARKHANDLRYRLKRMGWLVAATWLGNLAMAVVLFISNR